MQLNLCQVYDLSASSLVHCVTNPWLQQLVRALKKKYLPPLAYHVVNLQKETSIRLFWLEQCATSFLSLLDPVS